METEAAAAGLASAAEVTQLSARLVASRSRLEEATQVAQDLREVHLDLREQRISGMAAELAVGLAVGCSCPVCGSAEHPSPASASTRVSRADEDAARTAHETADFERQTAREAVRAVETQLEGARQRSQDLTHDHWERRHAAASSALAESSTAERDLPGLRSELAATDVRLRECSALLAASRATRVERLREHDEATRRCAGLDEELQVLLREHEGITSVTALVRAHAATVERLEEARDSLARQERAHDELVRATDAAESAAVEAGFTSVGQAMAAVLPGHVAADLTARLDRRRGARAAATAVLEEEQVSAALLVDAPDVPALEHSVREATDARDVVHAAHQRAESRVSRVRSLSEELEAVLTAWEPVRRDHALTAGLAALVEGKSVDNQLKMRLSAYVLGERLRQVVAAANERLVAMTDERYTLEQADEKGAGEQRGGLSLRVRDEWSGKRRDPATLSGGETFLVSLALALGLADTVSHEAGGTQLDTLFIDEGFGALDATTLDGVMDTLDSLRDGGRVVGLVSHVAELRNRVTSQLEVRKARRGSTVHASLASG